MHFAVYHLSLKPAIYHPCASCVNAPHALLARLQTRCVRAFDLALVSVVSEVAEITAAHGRSSGRRQSARASAGHGRSRP